MKLIACGELYVIRDWLPQPRDGFLLQRETVLHGTSFAFVGSISMVRHVPLAGLSAGQS